MQLESVGRFSENSKSWIDRASEDRANGTGELGFEKLWSQHRTGYDGRVMSKLQPLTVLEILRGSLRLAELGWSIP